MPKINWEEFSEIKHATQQERVIVCSSVMRLRRLNLNDPEIDHTIERLGILDKRLESFENYMVSLILKYDAENLDEQNKVTVT